MKRMIPDPGKIIKCSLKNIGRDTIIYVPIKTLDELPLRFDIIASRSGVIAPVYAYYSNTYGEVYGGCTFSIPEDGKGLINVTVDPDSLVRTENPYLKLYLSYDRGDIQEAPLSDDVLVFVTNIVHLEKGVITL